MEIISERHKETKVWYERCFEYAYNCGCGFPCDEQGNVFLDKMCPEAIQNYNDCINGLRPDLKDMGARKYTNHYTENAKGICTHCGKEVELHDQYCGACQCECGQWYTVNGQEINPPSMWEEPIEPEDYY